MIAIHRPKLWEIAPNALLTYREAFLKANDVLPLFGIDTELRAAHFLAQVLHESVGLTALVENLNYSAERLMVVWPTRFKTREAAEPFAHSPRALANNVYGGRNGNVLPDDGWTFRGRGMLQLTGRDNYEQVGKALLKDFINEPELVAHPDWSLSVAACFWRLHGCNAAADRDSVRDVTRLINGGQLGLKNRTVWLHKARRVVGGDEA